MKSNLFYKVRIQGGASKETGFQSISKSTMWRVVEDQEATSRKSLQGLDNTAAKGVDGFKDFLQIIDELERLGAEKDRCKEVRRGFRKQVVFEDYIPKSLQRG